MALLAFSGVSKSYWRGAHEIVVLRDVSFEIAPGDFAAVLADRRSGKTTLLEIAAGFARPDAGTVSYDGRPLSEMGDSEQARLRRDVIGCVWTVERWAARHVLDIVSIPLLLGGLSRTQAKRRAADELRRWEVGDVVTATIDELSDVERQRVAFARALVRRPRVLLADNPTETLNLIERNHILAQLQRVVREERIAVLITASDASGAVGLNRMFNMVGNGEVREADALTPAPVVPLLRRHADEHDEPRSLSEDA